MKYGISSESVLFALKDRIYLQRKICNIFLIYNLWPLNIRGLSQAIMDFCYNSRLCTSNSMMFKGCVYIHRGNIFYKYGWNRSLDNKFMNLYVTVCPHERRTSKYFQWNSSCPKGSVHLAKFRCCISNNALPHQLVTMQGKVSKIWNVCGYSHWFYKILYSPTTFLFFRKR